MAGAAGLLVVVVDDEGPVVVVVVVVELLDVSGTAILTVWIDTAAAGPGSLAGSSRRPRCHAASCAPVTAAAGGLGDGGLLGFTGAA